MSDEPLKIHTVRLLSFYSPEERKAHLASAQFNVVNLTPDQVTFDMCSKAVNAMSQAQRAGHFLGDEAYAGARNFEHLQQAVESVFGHSYVCPAHNLLGCLKLVVNTMVPADSVVPANSHRNRIELISAPETTVPDIRSREDKVFTGNIDLVKLEEILADGQVSVVAVEAFAEGQHPFSLENLRAVRALTRRYGKRLICDGSRVIENAWYIQRHEPGYADRSVADIVRQIAKTSTVFLVDGSQDPKCNTGGILTTDNPNDYELSALGAAVGPSRPLGHRAARRDPHVGAPVWERGSRALPTQRSPVPRRRSPRRRARSRPSGATRPDTGRRWPEPWGSRPGSRAHRR